MIFAMSSISLLGSLVWGHHMYTVGLESDTRAYFTRVTILISLPTGTKIFNWLFAYLGNPPLLHLRISSVFFSHLFLLMFTIGGSTGIILGNAAVDLGLHEAGGLTHVVSAVVDGWHFRAKSLKHITPLKVGFERCQHLLNPSDGSLILKEKEARGPVN